MDPQCPFKSLELTTILPASSPKALPLPLVFPESPFSCPAGWASWASVLFSHTGSQGFQGPELHLTLRGVLSFHSLSLRAARSPGDGHLSADDFKPVLGIWKPRLPSRWYLDRFPKATTTWAVTFPPWKHALPPTREGISWLSARSPLSLRIRIRNLVCFSFLPAGPALRHKVR